MNRHDQTAEVLTHMDSCPVCGKKLEQRDRSLIRCKTCGFTITVGNIYKDTIMLLAILAGAGFLLGILGAILTVVT